MTETIIPSSTETEAPAPAPATDTAPAVEESKKDETTPKPEKAKGKSKKVVIFRSKATEPVQFSVMDIKPVRNYEYPGHLEWRVPAEIAERFAIHYHVSCGRIQKVS